MGDATAQSGTDAGHTPESIARLPPKLRARLLQRGILKEAEVSTAKPASQPTSQPVGEAGNAQTVQAPAVPASSSSAAVLEAEKIFAKAASQSYVSMPEDVRQATHSKAASRPAGAAMASIPRKAAATTSTKAMATPAMAKPRSVYASAPVLNTEVVKRRAGEDPAEEPPAKRQEMQEPPIASPANVLADAAKAQGYKAPTWTFSNGAVSTDGQPPVQQAQPMAPPAAAPQATPPPADDGPPLPPGWVKVPHEGDFYYWNTTTDEVSWEHPRLPQEGKEKKPTFKEEHRVLWTDVGKIIGRQGLTLKILKASLGCTVKIPRQDGKGKGKDGEKGKGKGDGKGEGKATRGIGTGAVPLSDDKFATVAIWGETKYIAQAGKRAIEIMLGYGRNVERALSAMGVEAKMPKLEDLVGPEGKSASKDGIDPMDPAAYSEAPVGGWSAGLPKPDQKGRRGNGPEPADSRQANAERF